ncbi:hypothetical protein NPIL_281071 [Nephila pilipes]|uniref:Uncharacterized protein n=1 Tax=Nephila pilipes TaxID=299642 RepID=A0A8X6MCR4_NEPPI|nr:hypothetical protein NPIL_281071 [Nephila pilipes]
MSPKSLLNAHFPEMEDGISPDRICFNFSKASSVWDILKDTSRKSGKSLKKLWNFLIVEKISCLLLDWLFSTYYRGMSCWKSGDSFPSDLDLPSRGCSIDA